MRVKAEEKVVALPVVTTGAFESCDDAEYRIRDHPSLRVAFRKQPESLGCTHAADEKFAVSLVSDAFKPMVNFMKYPVWVTYDFVNARNRTRDE